MVLGGMTMTRTVGVHNNTSMIVILRQTYFELRPAFSTFNSKPLELGLINLIGA